MHAFMQVSAGLFNTTYGIPHATTIPADNTEHKVSSQRRHIIASVYCIRLISR